MEQRGFSLIELMAAIVIIAVIVAIALPSYQFYLARSQLSSGLSEVSAGKALFEAKLMDENSSDFDLDGLGLASETSRCHLSIEPAGDGFIRCELKGGSVVAGKTVEVARSSEGVWVCKIDASIPVRYWPAGCE